MRFLLVSAWTGFKPAPTYQAQSGLCMFPEDSGLHSPLLLSETQSFIGSRQAIALRGGNCGRVAGSSVQFWVSIGGNYGAIL
jgi:hypothetical protein